MYWGPRAGNTMRKIGPKRAAPPIPEDIEQIATHTQVGNINQYLLKSMRANMSENVVALTTAALESNDEEAVVTIGAIWLIISGWSRSSTAGELSNILLVTELVTVLLMMSL